MENNEAKSWKKICWKLQNVFDVFLTKQSKVSYPMEIEVVAPQNV